MKKLLCIILLFNTLLPTYGADVTITGGVRTNQGGIIRLVMFSDLISYKKIVLDKCELTPDGSFRLSAEINETTYAKIEYNFQTAEIFLEPGSEYDITVMPDKDPGQMAYYDRIGLTITINNGSTSELNYSIQGINLIYNDFLLQNAHLFNSPERKARVKEVIENMRSAVSGNENEYLLQYLRYKIASLEMYFRIKSNKSLAAEYLKGEPVLYDNVEYMDFFHIYFEKYLLANNTFIPYSKTSMLVNGTYTYEEIIKAMTNDPLLEDTRLAEMVLMKELDEMSTMAGFKSERIGSLLDQVALRSPFEKHRQIAVYLKQKINWMKPGSAAPGFELADVNGVMHRLEDYRGKYLYVSFIHLNSKASLNEMSLLADLYPDYKHRVEFISIIVDEWKPGWVQLTREYRMTWDLLLAGKDISLLEQYGATAPPVFILLDPEGKVYKYPAPSPSEDLKALLGSF
jgi:hypothetical protein